MRNHTFLGAAFALAAIVTAGPAAAQSDILLQLRSGAPAGDRFRADSAGGIVALGQIGVGIIPASGAGWRMMWHPSKVAFRAGYADASGQFDDANIGFYSWAGGALSTAAGNYSFAMGSQNTVEAAAQCGMALGSGNKVWGSGGDVGTCGLAVGLNNNVLDHVGVAIGQNNWSDGDAAVAIGYRTTADGDHSVAIGTRASTNGRTGAIVFGDASTTDSIEAFTNNEFAVRAAGGIRLYSDAALTTGCSLPAGSGSWSCTSSRAAKENFADVDGEEVLLRIRATPVAIWNYIAEGRQVRHMGPVAEDFHAAFGLGPSSAAIGLLDMDGVNFAAARALEARTAALRGGVDGNAARMSALEAELAAARKQLHELAARVSRLEQR